MMVIKLTDRSADLISSFPKKQVGMIVVLGARDAALWWVSRHQLLRFVMVVSNVLGDKTTS